MAVTASYAALDQASIPSRVAAWSTADAAQLQLTTATLTSGAKTVAYTLQLASAGGSGTGYVYDLISNLPAGMVMSSGGAISGTPLMTETRNVVIRVTDSVGNAVAKVFSLVIA